MRTRLLFTLAAVVLTAGLATADEKADVKVIVDKAVKAHGGLETLEKLKATRLKAKGTLNIMGQEIEFTADATSLLPDKFRNELKLEIMGQAIQVVQVFDGKKGWAHGMGETMELEGDELAELKDQAYHNYLESIGALAKDTELEIKVLPDEKVDGKPAAGLKITKKGYKEFRMFFDKESGLLVKTWHRSKDRDKGEEVDSETHFTNYKDVQGTKQAMKQSVKQDGKKYIEAELTEIKLMEKADASTFEKP